MPMPRDVIDRVNSIGRRQKMPTRLTYANRHGREIEDTLPEVALDDDDSSAYLLEIFKDGARSADVSRTIERQKSQTQVKRITF